MTIVPLFPAAVHYIDQENFGEYEDQIIEFVYEQENKNPMGEFFSNEGGWQSSPVYDKSDNVVRKYIQKVLCKYFEKSGYFKYFELRYNGIWLNINRNGDYNRMHNHPNSDWSGVLWIKVPENGGGSIHFEAPHSFEEYKLLKTYREEVKEGFNLYDCYRYPPKVGNMLIFPSYLLHEVLPNKAREDRISASFNIKIDFVP